MTQAFHTWMAELEARQLAELTFSEVARALRALSATYVERRAKLKEGAALSGAGKRAAFALYYGPLHYLLVDRIVSSIGEPLTDVGAIADLGCGTGTSGAAWAGACSRRPKIVAVDRNPWAAEEARRTYVALGFSASVRVGSLQSTIANRAPGAETGDRRPGSGRQGVLLAFAVNEIASERERSELLEALLRRAGRGERILIIEPLAGFVAPWWPGWAQAFVANGGRADEWRFRPDVPAIVEKLGRAAGLDYREVRGRSLSLAG
jgi:hypothetical protein